MNQKLLAPKKTFSTLICGLADLLLPNHCFLCGTPCQRVLCTDCSQDLPDNRLCCPRCAVPQTHNDLCGECLLTPPAFDRVISPFIYDEQVPQLINRFKHHSHLRLGKYLSTHLAEQIRAADDLPDLLTAVPLHWRRRLERGFNQSEIIAAELKRQLSLPVLAILRKTQATRNQQQLSRKRRLNNLKYSFSVTNEVNELHIGVVDDVVTTTATTDLLSRLLRRAGARKISVYCLARTPKEGH